MPKTAYKVLRKRTAQRDGRHRPWPRWNCSMLTCGRYDSDGRLVDDTGHS
jgi:hypothetical protein